VLRALICCVSKSTGGLPTKTGSAMLTTAEGFRQRRCRGIAAKRTGTLLALSLVIAPLLLACGTDGAGSAGSSETIVRETHSETNNEVNDTVACFHTMKAVNDMGHAAEDRGDFNRALEIWRKSARDGNEFSQASLCIFHVSESTPLQYRDYKEGFDICSSLAVHGFSFAQYVLARMYAAGLGVKKDQTEASY
jgi:hypothetical protein